MLLYNSSSTRHPKGDAPVTTSPAAFEQHDHAACIHTALAAAEATCAEKGLRLTAARRKVLSILLEAHEAMGAYDILGRLDGAAPPAAYRALSFLTEHGFAHRIERLNAYIACSHPGERHHPTFLICRSCHKVAETESRSSIATAARAAGFTVEQTVMEAEGICPTCQKEAE